MPICHVIHYIYRSLNYLSIILRYSGLFGLVWNSPVQGQVLTLFLLAFLLGDLSPLLIISWKSRFSEWVSLGCN
ncbi:hypothetical protein ACN42_g2277 [Penicillium freii]|uniref:Uncharacterized protein n=1 Tax=Penicillium freii TaxID=48697 RepID=A0A101MQG6_PENFR|nr:hypothetical protein ACN42_g2277 [Penicillium freii]